jgi:hypothetical protein
MRHTKHVTQYVGEIQELTMLKKWYVSSPLGSADLRLYINSYIVQPISFRTDLFK